MQSGIQWYPGHIAKYERQLRSLLKLVDVVVEVLDARIPEASTNHRLEKAIRNKPTLIVLNKSDLADPVQNARWQTQLTQGEHRAVLYDAKTAQGKGRLMQGMLDLAESAMQRLESRGRKRRPIRVLVAGMPNVGKSTLINSVVGRQKAKTGHRAGVTRETQWVRIHPQIELMDTPGIIPPVLESEEAGQLLAVVSAIGDAAFDEEAIARFLLQTLHACYPGLAAERFGGDPALPVTLEQVAEARHFKLGGGEPDLLRAAQALLSDFRHGRLGKVTLNHV